MNQFSISSATAKYQHLRSTLNSYARVLVAFSGGLDSSFVLFAARETLGAANVRAVIGVSPSLAKSELDSAIAFAQEIGLPESNLIQIETKEFENSNYTDNPPDRCFFCKSELYQHLNALLPTNQFEVICDGTNASDIGDYRPGREAARQKGIKSPLLEADLSKEEIQILAREFGLSVWDKPQSACLSSRIPYGSEVTEQKLKQIEEAEAFLKSLGFRQLRVRHHGSIARVELPTIDMQRVVNNGLGEKIVRKFRELGFLYVTIDLSGFKSGSMNAMLKRDGND